MIINTITEAKAQLSALIEKVQTGEDIIINKAGKPIAILQKYNQGHKQRKPGAFEGQINISSDFDELPDDLSNAFGINNL